MSSLAASAPPQGQVPASTLLFCELCSKPFTCKSSWTRHQTYCRRTRDHPRKRRSARSSRTEAKETCESPAPEAQSGQILADEGVFGTAMSFLDFDLVPSDRLGHDGFLQTPYLFEKSTQPAIVSASANVFDQITLLDDDTDALYDAVLQRNEAVMTIPDATSLLPTTQIASLSRLRLSDPAAQRCAVLIMQDLRAYPTKMLRRDNLPPFIHAHSNSNALPVPLAICMSIAQTFAVRTQETSGYIWRSIRTEQKRFADETHNMTKEDLLAALQAHLIYLLMRIVDGSSEPAGWNQDMLYDFKRLCKALLEVHPVCPADDESFASLTWETWIFAESWRRLGCIWFLISKVANVQGQGVCATLANACALSLPAPRIEWEATTRTDWEQAVQFGSRSISTLGELVECHQRHDEPENARKLDAWNSTTDGLGHLLNIATSLM